MTASARTGGVPILSVLSAPARAFLLGTVAISLVAIVLRYAVGVDDTVLFLVSAAGILGLAWTVGLSTERLGSLTGPQVGGILNATFGNIAELIIAFFALQAGLVEVVKASLTGSIIGNLLLVLGAGVLIGGLRHGTQTFSARIASKAALLVVAVIGLFVPAVFAFTSGEGRGTVTEESVLVAIGALIVGYALSLGVTAERRVGVRERVPAVINTWPSGAPRDRAPACRRGEEYRHLVPGTFDRAVLGAPADLLTLLPGGLPQPFTTGDLAVELRRPRRTAQHLAYCLARAGVVEAVGKRAHAIEYRIAVPR